ncbi:MAG: hypothetical protein ACM65L_21165 [Microcoleus sp.]
MVSITFSPDRCVYLIILVMLRAIVFCVGWWRMVGDRENGHQEVK